MNKKNWIWLVVAIAVVIAGVFIYKSQNKEKTNDNVIKIGAILPLTGKTSFIGQSIANGLSLAEKQYPGKIKIYYEDCQGDPKLAIASYKKLKNLEGIRYFIPALSSVTNALINDAEKDNSLLFSTCVSSSRITEKSPILYRLFLNSDGDARIIADYAIDSLKYKKFAVIFVNDDFGKDYATVFEDEVEGKGGEIVFQESFDKKANDYKDILIKLKENKNYDAIYLLGYDNNFGILLKQIAESEIKKTILSIATIAQPIVIETIKNQLSMLPDIYYTNTMLYAKNNVDQTKVHFINSYKNFFGTEPNYFAGFAYDWISVLVNSDLSKYPISLQNVSFDGVMGKIRFNQNRDAEFPVVIEKLKKQ